MRAVVVVTLVACLAAACGGPDPPAVQAGAEEALPGKSTKITLRVDPDDPTRCVADTQDKKIKLKREDFIVWRLQYGGGPNACVRPEGAIVEIRFTDDDTPLEPVRPRGTDFIAGDVRPDADFREFHYGVWMVLADGTAYEMEDPDIEIIQPGP